MSSLMSWRVRFHVTIDSLLFDRDTAFNKRFRAALLKRDVCPDMSGAYDHYQLGSIEKYWGVWQSTVAALLMHGGVDETHWKFAAQMTIHVLNRLPTSSNLGHVSPIEYLTKEEPDLSHFRAPLSPSFVTQDKSGSLLPRARAAIFVGYPEFTLEGTWRHYFKETKSVQTSRHAVFDEYSNFPDHDDPEVRAARAAALAKNIAMLESHSLTKPKGKQRPPPPILAAALAADDYFVCSPLADKATGYIRDRSTAYHGKRLSTILFTVPARHSLAHLRSRRLLPRSSLHVGLYIRRSSSSVHRWSALCFDVRKPPCCLPRLLRRRRYRQRHLPRR
jgi:hypothetical protein